jgi:hypothetical protein
MPTGDIGDEQHTLHARDSIYFDSTVAHAYRKSGAKACCALSRHLSLGPHSLP